MIRWFLILANGYFVWVFASAAVGMLAADRQGGAAMSMQLAALMALNVILLLAPGNPKK